MVLQKVYRAGRDADRQFELWFGGATNRKGGQDLLCDLDEACHIAHWSAEAVNKGIVQRVAEDRVHPFLSLELAGEAACEFDSTLAYVTYPMSLP